MSVEALRAFVLDNDLDSKVLSDYEVRLVEGDSVDSPPKAILASRRGATRKPFDQKYFKDDYQRLVLARALQDLTDLEVALVEAKESEAKFEEAIKELRRKEAKAIESEIRLKGELGEALDLRNSLETSIDVLGRLEDTSEVSYVLGKLWEDLTSVRESVTKLRLDLEGVQCTHVSLVGEVDDVLYDMARLGIGNIEDKIKSLKGILEWKP